MATIFEEPQAQIQKEIQPETPTIPLAGTDRIAQAREEVSKINEQVNVGKREFLYQDLKIRKAKNEITGHEYLKNLESMVNTVSDEDEKMKWKAELSDQKIVVLRENQDREDKKIQIAVNTEAMSFNQAVEAYNALATQSMIAGDVDGALGYQLTVSNMVAQQRIKSASAARRGGGGGGGGSGRGSSGGNKIEAKKMAAGLEAGFKQAKLNLNANSKAIEQAYQNGEIDDAAYMAAKKEMFGQYKSNIFGIVSGDTYDKYMQSGATDTQKFTMLEYGTQASGILKGYGGNIEIAKVLSDKSGLLFESGLSPEDINDLSSPSTAYSSVTELSADDLGVAESSVPEQQEFQPFNPPSVEASSLGTAFQAPKEAMKQPSQESQRQSNPLGILGTAAGLATKGKDFFSKLFR